MNENINLYKSLSEKHKRTLNYLKLKEMQRVKLLFKISFSRNSPYLHRHLTLHPILLQWGFSVGIALLFPVDPLGCCPLLRHHSDDSWKTWVTTLNIGTIKLCLILIIYLKTMVLNLEFLQKHTFPDKSSRSCLHLKPFSMNS